MLLLTTALILGLAGCPTDADDGGGVGDGINWDNETSGTLTVINNTGKDMVIFQGQTPSASTILGGVRGTSTRVFDVSDDVDDFGAGGYMILRGMTLNEYNANKANLSAAKVEYSAMATYGSGKKYRAEISSSYTGDYYFKVTNGGKIGIELRKDSPDGEKIGYLPALATNYLIYAASTNSMTVYPVYVYYSTISKEVTTIKPSSWADSASIGPRPVTESSVSTLRFPASEISWASIVGNITYPVAFITVTNNVTNQDARFASSSKVYFAQNGYDSVNSGETNTFEITATNAGQSITLNMQLYGGNLAVPVKDGSGNTPTIKNGYDYAITLTLTGGAVDQAASYTAVITEGSKRDVASEISSL
jgi:hypothetical protein